MKFLLDAGYPAEVGKLSFEPSFPIRGLALDNLYGNLLKVGCCAHEWVHARVHVFTCACVLVHACAWLAWLFGVASTAVHSHVCLLLQLDAFGHVINAYHGRKCLTEDEIEDVSQTVFLLRSPPPLFLLLLFGFSRACFMLCWLPHVLCVCIAWPALRRVVYQPGRPLHLSLHGDEHPLQHPRSANQPSLHL